MEENKFLVLWKKNSSRLLTLLLLLVLLALAIERSFHRKKEGRAQDFFQALLLKEGYEAGEALSKEFLSLANEVVSRHPELHAVYDGMLLHLFYAGHQPHEALSLAKAQLERVRSKLPEAYLQFSETSLLISKKEYEKAYADSLTLEERLKNSSEFEMLRGFNLLRILILSSHLPQKGDTKHFQKTLTSLPIYGELEGIFQEGRVTLKEYLELL